MGFMIALRTGKRLGLYRGRGELQYCGEGNDKPPPVLSETGAQRYDWNTHNLHILQFTQMLETIAADCTLHMTPIKWGQVPPNHPFFP